VRSSSAGARRSRSGPLWSLVDDELSDESLPRVVEVQTRIYGGANEIMKELIGRSL
jgi:hypothetical protein